MTRTTVRAGVVLPPASDDRELILVRSHTRSVGSKAATHEHPITQAMRPDLPVRGGEPPRGIVRSRLG